MDTSITCSVCSKIYTSRHGYSNHITLNRCKIKDDSVNCKYCSKTFSTKSNRKTHEAKCVGVYNSKLQVLEEKIEKLELMTKANALQVTNNNVTNINNGNIIINNFGNEDTSHITQKQMIRAFKMCKEFPLEMIKMIHFNKDKPENHNIYKPNFKDKYVKYFNDNVWKMGDAVKIITELYMSKMDIAEERFEELKPYLSEITKDRFQWFLDNREETEVMREIIKKICEMMYNDRGIVMNHD